MDFGRALSAQSFSAQSFGELFSIFNRSALGTMTAAARLLDVSEERAGVVPPRSRRT